MSCDDTDGAVLLVRLGAALIALGVSASLWASPDRLRSLPYVVLALLGAALVFAAASPWWQTIARRVRATHVALFFLCMTVPALLTTLLTSRWPSYKLSWLNTMYSAIPSLRSLPYAWAADGLQPNQTGGFLAVCVAFVLGFLISRPIAIGPRRRWPAAALGAAGIPVVFMTGSRAALAALAMAVLTVLVIRTLRWAWVWAAGALVTVAALATSGSLGRILDFFLRDESLGAKLAARLDIWASALRGVEDHVFTGIGLNVFNQVIPLRYPYQTVSLSYPVSQAHNLILDVTLAIGLPGAVGLMSLLLGCVLLAVRGARDHATVRAVSLGILASIVAYLIFGITDSISLSVPTSFIIWLWASALVTLVGRSQAGTRPHTAKSGGYNLDDPPSA